MPRGVRKDIALLTEFARTGAEARVRELEAEMDKLYEQIQAIRRAVPGLRLKRRGGPSGREQTEFQAQEFAASIRKERMSSDERAQFLSRLPPRQRKRVETLLAEGKPTRKRRKGMSAAARAAVSKRMKAYWAAKRKAEKS